MSEPTGPAAASKRNAWPAFLGLTTVACIAALAVSFTDQVTRERSAANRIKQALKIVAEVLPADSYNNQPQLDSIRLLAPDWLGSTAALPAYRARLNGTPVATAITVVAPDGYVGSIRLLVGIEAQGRIAGVRVLEHQETPGLGDKIDRRKSAWIDLFTGQQLSNDTDAYRTRNGWALKRDGGRFDHITGATITSRATVNAVYRALNLYTLNAQRISQAPVDAELPLGSP